MEEIASLFHVHRNTVHEWVRRGLPPCDDRRRHVGAESGLSRSTLYVRIRQGLWTTPVRIGPRAVGWPAQEVAVLHAARIARQSDAELRKLVTRLHAARAVQTSSGQRNEDLARG